jgi:hypothetical protein
MAKYLRYEQGGRVRHGRLEGTDLVQFDGGIARWGEFGELSVNDDVRQSHTTVDLLFEPAQLVSWLSHMGTLNPADV